MTKLLQTYHLIFTGFVIIDAIIHFGKLLFPFKIYSTNIHPSNETEISWISQCLVEVKTQSEMKQEPGDMRRLRTGSWVSNQRN